MQALPWTPFDPTWEPLSDEQRRALRPEQAEVYDLYTWRNLSRRSPADFARTVEPSWEDLAHITYISGIINEFVHDRLLAPNGKPARRLFLTMPPRHGKSFLLSQHVPSWYLSLFPDRQVILTTYEAEFAAKWGGKNRAILEAHGDKYGLSLAADSQAKNRWALAKPFLGGMITAGKGGPITGEGGGLLVGDDWVKNAAEANSPVQRENDWDWYTTTFRTRGQKDLANPLAPPPKILLLMTRWHDDDIMGRLLNRSDGDLVVIHLPALAGDDDPLGRLPGEALCPKIMSAEELHEFKTEDPASFEALYQGNPTPDEGGLFSKSKFRTWRYLPGRSEEGADGETATGGTSGAAYILKMPEGAERLVRAADCRHFITTDWAISEKKSADFTVFALWALTPERDLLLISRFRERIEEADHIPALQRFYEESEKAVAPAKIPLIAVERQSFGLSVIKNGRKKSSMPIMGMPADQDKVSRALPVAGFVREGHYYLPEHADWAEEWISEHTTFPTGKHDDQVDTSSYAALAAEKWYPGKWRTQAEIQAESEGRTVISDHIDRIAKRNAKARKRNPWR